MNQQERRQGFDRRVTDLESTYSAILERLDKIEATLTPLVVLSNQITGVLYFLRFVGWGGLATIGFFLLRFLTKSL